MRAMNPRPAEKSIKNLKSFEKGNKCGGRKPGSVNLRILLQKMLQCKIKVKNDTPFFKKGDATAQQVICASLLARAIKGDLRAAALIFEKTDGVHQHITYQQLNKMSTKELEEIVKG